MRVRNWKPILLVAIFSVSLFASTTQATGPSITSLSPTSGAVGASVTIAGSGFGATQGTSTVTFSGTAAAPTSWSADTLQVLVPSGATSGNVVVTVAGVASNGASFTVVPAPAISSLSVTSGVVGTSVTITGTNFGAAQGSGTVSFNGTDATSTSWSATSIVVTVPLEATTGNVVVSASGVASNSINFTVLEGLGITSVSPTSGVVGTEVAIAGIGFGSAQGSSTISLNGTAAVVASWSDTSIITFVPSGASTGPFTVTVNGNPTSSSSFTVTPLPSGWTDGDIGSVGVAGSATYANGQLTVKGAGQGISTGTTSDAINFAYQSLSGDGTIVARVVSLQGASAQAGVMIRETLNAGATNGYTFFWNSSSSLLFDYRTTTGGSTTGTGQGSLSLPYWVKLIRSGNSFSACRSADGVNWTQTGSIQTITMASSVYIGIAVSSQNTSALATATFDNVSINSAASPAPVITNVSATTGSIGSQVVISGTGFGTTQNGSVVLLNDSPVTINSWSGTSISVTIPTGATSGYMAVSVSTSMNASNAVGFAVTSQPLPTLWLNQDIGQVGLAGSATYSSGVFTVKGAGQGVSNNSTSDTMQFVYQPLSGDGTIIARVVSLQGASAQAGVMIRETLSPGATSGCTYFWNTSSSGIFSYRTITGGNAATASKPSLTLPYWVKVVRSGNSFSAYGAPDGMNWVQIGSTQTITMAQNVYMGLAVSSQSTTALATATFDNVSTSSTVASAPVITSISATTGSVGSQVLISGTGFGTTQNGSVVTLNALPVTINSWTNTSIMITVPTGATTGYLVVSVAPSMNNSNPFYFTVTSQPLPTFWLDQDAGQVGLVGSATYANGLYTVKGAGTGISNGLTSDGLHFVYQPWSGDGTIVARIASMQGPGGWEAAGVMIRETLSPGSKNACACFTGANTYAIFSYRATTGGSTSLTAGQAGHTLPYWVKLVRSGNSISAYWSTDGSNYWIQLGTTQTITMAQNVYIGLAVTSGSTTTLATATMDDVSITSTATPAPAITSISATTGSVGSQVLITGTGFGATQNGSFVFLNDSPVTINSWSATSIAITIPTGATPGYMVVSVAQSMNDSNAVFFTITSQPLPTPWLDQDVGQVGLAGSATYPSGVITVQGAGNGVWTGTSSDGVHFVYQPLSGDGTVIARVASLQGASAEAGVMIRETLDPAATDAFSFFSNSSTVLFDYRTTTGGSTSGNGQAGLSLPYWVKLVRSSSTFAAYRSSDGVTWTQTGTSQTISMAQNVYIGLAVSSRSTTALATATFDNVAVTIGTTPFVTGVSPILGPVGTSVTVTGSDFGTTQGTSTLTFDGVSATSVSSWTNSQIAAQVPSTTPPGPGPVVVTVGSISSPSIVSFTTIKPTINSLSPPASQPLSFVMLNGSGFGASVGTSVVYFNGVATWNQSWSDTSVTVQVPPNATSGPVTVTVDGVTSNGVTFTVLEALSVTSISQNVGPVGTSVTITGTGFGPTQSSSIASFYGAAGNVSSWSDTQIVATVTSDASSGPVSVIVGNVAAQGPWFTLSSSVSLTDSLGNPTTYTAEVIGARWLPVSSQGSGCSSCTMRGTIQQTYDSRGNVLTKTNELGATTSYTYDSNNNVTSVSVPIAPDTFATTSYTYNSFGEVLTTTDPMGNVTRNTYDTNGNLLTVTSPAPNGNTAASVTQFAYNSLGELTQITDPLNNATTLTYTSAGLINTITDAQSHVTTYGYDSHGNRTSVKDANNQTTSFAYDAGDRLKTITYPDSTTTTFTYDVRGRRTSVTDQNGKTTTYAYDDADRLTSVTDAATPGNVTSYGYDTENNLMSIQDANGHTTTFDYDAFGRVTQTNFPSSQSEYYYYDAVGNLIQKTDRKNQTITYTYDQLNRLLQKLYPDSTAVNYTYDNDSRLTQVTDPTGTYQFTFDNMGRLTQAVTQYSFLTGRNFTTAYTYDKASNRTGFTDPEGGSTAYVYDTLNRLQTLTPPTAFSGSGNFGFSYDVLSRRTQMTRPNGITTNYSYDNLSRLLSVLHQSGSTTLDGATYTVDNAGNRTAKTDQYANVTSNYTYDPIYELTQVTQATTTTESYTYDAVGNRLSSLGVSPYSVNVSNELTSTPSTTYTYDYNGNTATKVDSTGTTTYAWDFENRLTSVTLPGSGGTVSFAYDPFGRRIKKVTSSTTSVFAYDGDNLVEETNAAGAVVARYEDTQNIDEPLAMLRGGATSYYHADGLGSVTSLSNGTGSLAQTYGYDSFGKQTSSSGSLTNPFQYTARESDTETRLYYYRARYYDPNTGRFVSEDPVDFEAGTNFYDYVANDPTVFIDPWGLWHCVAGIDCNITPDLKNALECFDKCTNGETVVTSARRPPSPKHPNGSHSRGEACDLNRANNPGVTRPDAERCRKQCFANGYGQEENNRPDYKPQNPDDPSTHYHFQLRTVPGAQPGFGQGIKPYNP